MLPHAKADTSATRLSGRRYDSEEGTFLNGITGWPGFLRGIKLVDLIRAQSISREEIATSLHSSQ